MIHADQRSIALEAASLEVREGKIYGFLGGAI